ncbi:hypothetical protein GCM10010218_35170 [Streptomyces mashuensis]|uniref:Uncharacterized protein n=1 Tax=Streptomyces mashuensis TaxID=33904 RepID=A0A919EDP8_9ACTN|nr:hypothetical protein GCM10010218_35170 [Streptomyces mashuensis]
MPRPVMHHDRPNPVRTHAPVTVGTWSGSPPGGRCARTPARYRGVPAAAGPVPAQRLREGVASGCRSGVNAGVERAQLAPPHATALSFPRTWHFSHPRREPLGLLPEVYVREGGKS